MCALCLQTPCHPCCPNAPEPVAVIHCKKCGSPLYSGEKHYDGICEECLDEMTTKEWLELFGEKLEELDR